MLSRRAAGLAAALLAATLPAAGCSAGSGADPARSHAPTGSGTASSTAASPPAVRTGPAAPGAGPAALSDEQLVGQLFMTYVYGSSASQASPAQRQANIALYGEPAPADVVRRWHLGGVILLDHNELDPDRPTLSTGNVTGAGQIRELTSGLQSVAQADTGVPLLVATDQEGGRVQRLRAALPALPSQRETAALGASQLRCRYVRLGQSLRDLGVTMDLAPVADVVRGPGGVIADRSFGADPAATARDVAAAVTGLRQAGVVATLKHWPGHGGTPTDSHGGLAVLPQDAGQWRAVDRPPFAAALPDAAAVMVGHLALPALDPSGAPATLSPVLVAGELRRGLGFTGVVVTDSLWMAPMRAAGTPAEVALRALLAGGDLLLETPDLPAAWAALLTAVRQDPAVRAAVTAAAGRVLAAKRAAPPADPPPADRPAC